MENYARVSNTTFRSHPLSDRTDIASRADIVELTSTFYTRAFADEMLGPIFIDIAKMDLAHHLPIICDFWENILFRTGGYRGGAFAPHVMLNQQVALDWPKFERWLEIWTGTIDDLFAGPYADIAKTHATNVAHAFSQRLAMMPRIDFRLPR
jgi:hemoglobin